MARYKDVNKQQSKMIPIDFDSQILPGTFEHTLNYLIDNELDLSIFDDRYHNDETGAPAFSPAVLLKIILYAYSRGIISSRKIEQACRENIIFMALSHDTQPHFTTIADFVSSMENQITALFRNVLLICDDMKLIGNDMFAIDGVKLPCNAAKEWSGTKWELQQKKNKLDKAVRAMLKHHRQADQQNRPVDSARRDKEKAAIDKMKAKAKKLKEWLDDNDDKPGKSGPKKSNVTDNDSAKIKTSKGVIQGYDGIAAVDSKHQIILHGEAFGEAQEQALLIPMIDATEQSLDAIEVKTEKRKSVKLTADSGFYNAHNIEALMKKGVDAYLPDIGFRKRDPRFNDVERYRARAKKERQIYQARRTKQFIAADFHYDESTDTCTCPAGKKLYKSGRHKNLDGYEALHFKSPIRHCDPCALRQRCMRNPDKTRSRQVAIIVGRAKQFTPRPIDLMKQKIDTPEGRYQYSRRMGIVEPVFAHMCSALKLNRFSLRGKTKVDIQWKLYCMVHNLLKIHRYGINPA